MPLINNSTGVQIHGGTFYEVSGDVNLETHQHLLIHDHTRHDTGLRLPFGSTLTLEEGSDAGYRRELSSVARNPRHETGGRPSPYGLSSRPRLIAKGSSSIVEHPHPVSRSSTSLSREPRLGFRPTTECISEFHQPTTLPSINLDSSESHALSSHSRDYRPSNLADLASFPARPHQNYRTLRSRDTVQSAPDFQRGPQGPRDRGDPVGAESRSEGRLAHFPAEPLQAIHGGTFISAENINHHRGETAIQILHHAVALEALYDSAESFPQPRCHPVTRTNMLDSLYSWATEENTTYSIYWLSGPAGAGKSAIMQTLCQRLQDTGRLAGSFFFKRAHSTRGNAKALFVTLAYQLALHHPELKGPISESAEDDPSVVGRGMDTQLCKLIIEPCTARTNSPTIILLIDGLDECNGHDVQQEILRLLASAVSEHPVLRILIASRPEPQISQVFKEPGMTGLYHLLNIRPSFMDIRNYLLSEFNRIHREHEETMASVPTPWPTREIFEVLVDKSSGYFIYAATIIKFIDDRDFRPTERLAAVVENLPPECGTPFHALDELYSQILCDVPSQSRMLDILCVIVRGSELELELSTKNIESLLGLNPGDVKFTLRRLQSLLLVPQDETDVISLHHKSFRDFLIDPNRSGKFHPQRKDMARLILQALSHSPANKARPSLNHVGWEIAYSGLEYITSMIPPSADLVPFIQTINFDFFLNDVSSLHTQAKKMIHWLKECVPLPEDLITLLEDCFITSKWHRPITAHLSDGACHTILSQSPGLLRILQAWWVCRTAFPWIKQLQLVGLLYIRFVLQIPWDEMWAIIRAPLSLIGGRSSKKLCILLNFTLRDTTICPEVYPWPSTCRDLAQGCIRLLVDPAGLPSHQGYNILAIWVQLIRLSLPCNDLLADVRNLSPSPAMDGFDIHIVLEWLKTFPQPPLDVINCWQEYLDECRRRFHWVTSYCPTFKECEERWTEFRNQMASRRQEEIQRWDEQIVAQS